MRNFYSSAQGSDLGVLDVFLEDVRARPGPVLYQATGQAVVWGTDDEPEVLPGGLVEVPMQYLEPKRLEEIALQVLLTAAKIPVSVETFDAAEEYAKDHFYQYQVHFSNSFRDIRISDTSREVALFVADCAGSLVRRGSEIGFVIPNPHYVVSCVFGPKVHPRTRFCRPSIVD